MKESVLMLASVSQDYFLWRKNITVFHSNLILRVQVDIVSICYHSLKRLLTTSLMLHFMARWTPFVVSHLLHFNQSYDEFSSPFPFSLPPLFLCSPSIPPLLRCEWVHHNGNPNVYWNRSVQVTAQTWKISCCQQKTTPVWLPGISFADYIARPKILWKSMYNIIHSSKKNLGVW